MIANMRQYYIAELTLKKCVSRRQLLLATLHMAKDKVTVNQEIDNLQRKAMLITNEMKDFMSVVMERVMPPDLSAISNLPVDLIRARIALGWHAQKLARHYGVSPSQIHRWESTLYASASLSTVLKIAQLLNSHLKQKVWTGKYLGKPLKLGCDWFNYDFRDLGDN